MFGFSLNHPMHVKKKSFKLGEVPLAFPEIAQTNLVWERVNGSAFKYSYYNGIWGDGTYWYTCGADEYPSTGLDLILTKWDSNGNVIWMKYYRGNGGATEEVGNDVWGDGTHIYTCGRTDKDGTTDMLINKWDTNGNIVWSNSWGGPGYDATSSIWGDPAGDIVFTCGHTTSGDSDASLVFWRTDTGEYYGDYTWGGPFDDICFSITGNEQGLYLCGRNGTGSGNSDLFLMKTDFFESWETSWNGDDDDGGAEIWLDGNDIYTCGFTESKGSGGKDLLLVKWREEGGGVTEMWNRTFGGFQDDQAYSVWGNNNYIYTTGKSDSYDEKLILLKWDKNGILIWSSTWEDPESSFRPTCGTNLMGDGDYIYTCGWVDYNFPFSMLYGNRMVLIKWNANPEQLDINLVTPQGVYATGSLIDVDILTEFIPLESATFDWLGDVNGPALWSEPYYQYIPSVEGSHTLHVHASTKSDFIYEDEYFTFIADIGPPEIEILTPTTNQIIKKGTIPSFDLRITEPNIDEIWYTLNGGPRYYISSDAGTFDENAWNSLDYGKVTVNFSVTDVLGGIGSDQVIIEKSSASLGLDNIIGLLIGITIVSMITIVPTVLAIKISKHKRYMRLLAPPESVGKFSIEFQANKGTIEITHKDEEMYKVEIDVHAPNKIRIIHPINEDALKSYLQDVNKINVRGKKRSPNKDKDKKYEKYSEMEELMKVGEMYYSACIPTEIQEELESTSLKTFELRLETDFLQYPWEIFHDGKQFMGLEYNLGRIIVLDPKKRHRIKYPDFGVRNGVTFLIIGDPEENLPWAKSEAKFLRDELKKIEGVDVTCLFGQEANSRDIGKAFLEGYDFIHYCGHAGFDTDKPHESGICLSDRLFKAYEIKNIKMKKPPILAFINGCESSKVLGVKDAPYENQVSGLASSFYQKGINYIGSLWKVDDKVASNTALKFYFDFLEGYPMGESLRNARNYAYITFNKENSTWASYVLYGDPTLKLRREEEIKEDKKSKGKIKKKK